jgi:sulfite reductase alpha subunit-like flavoprotein
MELNLGDILLKYKGVKVPLDVFYSKVPSLAMTPRKYTIASSTKDTKSTVDIVATVPKASIMLSVFSGSEKAKRPWSGLCTHFMESLEPNEAVRGRVVPTDLGLPEDTENPLVIVVNGSGFALAKALLEDRKVAKKEGKKLGECMLIFGMRKSDKDELYASELHQMEEDGILTTYVPCYSRDPEKVAERYPEADHPDLWEVVTNGEGDEDHHPKGKMYTQLGVREFGKDIKALWDKGAHFYFCGGHRPWASVQRELIAAMGWPTIDGKCEEFNKHAKDKNPKNSRIITEVFG